MRVLIVGAGVAGLALARALHQRDVTAEVVERVTHWESSGAGLYLPGNAVRALDELGIEPAVTARANPIVRQRFLDHHGRRLADIDVHRYWNGVGACVAIHRAALHEVLLEATAEVPTRLGTSVTDVEDGQAPQVTFSDGSTGSYDLVVGADGVHSTIRSLALGGPPARYVGQASWRFLADGFPDISDWTVMLGRGRTFLTVALGAGDGLLLRRRQHQRPGRRWRAKTGASRLPTSPNRSRACSNRPPRRTSRPSRRSCRRPGGAAASFSSATPLTPAHRTWRRERRWPSRTLSCSPRWSPPTNLSIRRWRLRTAPSSPGGVGAGADPSA